MEPGDSVQSGQIGPPAERVGDAERENVVTLLREHCTAGRLTLDEFSERVGTALAAHTRGDLQATLADLPSLAPAASPVVSAAPAPAARRIRRWAVAVLSGTSERGRYQLGPHINAVALLGSCQLDLRQAVITERDVEITAIAVMGAVEIVVPEGVEVELVGLAILGSKDLHVRDTPPIPGTPRILVRAVPIMGSVDVKSRPSASHAPALDH